jgi:hypothetical protein
MPVLIRGLRAVTTCGLGKKGLSARALYRGTLWETISAPYGELEQSLVLRCGLGSELASFSQFDFDPQLDLGQDRIETRIARGRFEVGGRIAQPADRRCIEIAR